MRAIRSKGMKPEMIVRRAVHRLGYRFRLHRKDLPGKPDLAFIGLKKAIFVHGCFWHQHPDCRDGRVPGTNQAYWKPKLQRNVERDRASISALLNAGWQALVIWECELKNMEALQRKVLHFLSD